MSKTPPKPAPTAPITPGIEHITPKAGKTVKVRFLRSHPAFGYFAGQVGEISTADFEKYSKDGAFFEKV